MTTLLPDLFATMSIAVDSVNGNLFIFDNSAIRQISMASQTMTTLAGAGYNPGSSFSNGVGTNAIFGYSAAIVMSSNGHLYLSDNQYKRVRQIVISTQVVSTLAGDGLAERKDGAGTNSRFNNPGLIATDSTGNLYVQDGYSIRKIVISSGDVTTLAGFNVPNVQPNFPMNDFFGLFFGRGQAGNRLLYAIYSNGVLTINVDNGLLGTTFMNSGLALSSSDGSAMDSSGILFVTGRLDADTKCFIQQYDVSQSTLATTFLVGSATTECASVDGVGADIRVSGISGNPRMTVDSANGILYVWEPQSKRIRALQASASCSAGSYCPSGSSALNQGGPCPAGYFCRKGSDRMPCLAGTYCNAGTAAPGQALSCLAGFYCPAGSSLLNQAGPCPAGFFCATRADRAACTPGQYCPAGSSSLDQGGDCAAGYYCPSGRERVACVGSYCAGRSIDDTNPCTAGYACPGGGVVRQICSFGTYATGGNVTTCTVCPRGLVAANTGAFLLATIPVDIVLGNEK
jgi:hypothetical protein